MPAMTTAHDAIAPGRRAFLASSALAGVAALAPARADAATPHCDRRDQGWIPDDALLAEVPRLMAAFKVPGLAIAAVEGGRLAWSQGFGVLHAGRATPVQAGTVFEDASLSKPVFAYLVMQLADLGVLDLDRPLVTYRRPDYLGDHPWLDLITARDVLRHSTGLPNWRKHPATERLVPQVKPGTRIDYSGEAIFWLQLVVEALTGQSLDESMQAHLFGPAGMRDSSYTWSPALAERSVHGHRAHDAPDASDDRTPGEPASAMPPQMLREQWTAAQQVADRWGKPLSRWTYADATRALPEVIALTPPGLVTWPGDILANAAASLRTTVADYATFMTLMLAGRQRSAWEASEASREAMLTAQIEIPGRWTEKGLGWNIESTPSGPVFYHSGSNGGIFKNFAIGDAPRQRALVVLTNAGSGNIVYRRIVRAATGHDLLAFDL